MYTLIRIKNNYKILTSSRLLQLKRTYYNRVASGTMETMQEVIAIARSLRK